jgi:formylglycine-generating enzyme required for sulfatase activity
LPTEQEWEVAAGLLGASASGNFLENGIFHPTGNLQDNGSGGFLQMFGSVWEWTNSAYLAVSRLPAGERSTWRIQR